MLAYPDINPIALQIGPLAVHWYGLMYLIGFAGAYGALAYRIKTSDRGFTMQQLSDMLFYAAMGVIIGGRLGYMFFYDWYDVIHNPLRVFMIWKGGMSFHGGLLGVTAALWLYGRKINKTLGEIGDFACPAIPLGFFTGRIGNFINDEIWGRVTDVPWAMIFPNAGDNMLRHPSQLYESFLEGVLLFTILWIFSRKPRPIWSVAGLFLVLYAFFRFSVEFFREPDSHVGYLIFGFTEGQLLCVPMFIWGIIMMVYAYQGNKHEAVPAVFKAHS